MKNLEIVISEAEASWNSEESNLNGSRNAYKPSYILGWLKSAYKSLYEDYERLNNKLPPNLQKKYDELWGRAKQ